MQWVQPHGAVGLDPRPLARRLPTDEAAVLQAEQVGELRGHADHHVLGVLPLHDLFGHPVDAVQAVAALRRGASVLVPTGGQLADQQADQDEEQFGGQVGLMMDLERLVRDR